MRGRRNLRACGRIVLLVLAGAAVTGGLAAPPATASPNPRIALTVIGGDTEISAAWDAVRGATSYSVRWGQGSHLDHTASTRSTSMRLSRVADRQTYSVQVFAVGAPGESARRSARTVPYVPNSISSVKAVPAGANQIAVSWSGGGQARSVKVMAGADSMTEAHHFSTAWMPAAVHAVVLTVPPSLRGVLGAGTGNAVFIKIAQTNSRRPNPAESYRFSLSQKYRLTPSGTWSLAGMPAALGPSTPLKVATWNVQSVTASARYAEQDRWAQRLPKVVANIEAHAPDLIGLQELTTARIEPDCLNHGGRLDCVEQYQTLQTALATTPVRYANARTDANAWVYANPGSYVDSALFFDPTKLAVEDSGFISPRDLLGRRWPTSLPNEAGMWARFGMVGAGGVVGRAFDAVSIHLPAGDEGEVREAEATAIARFMDTRARQSDGTSIPVVFMGDFNGNGARQSDAGSLRLIADGYVDAAATADRTNLDFSTANQTNGVGGVDADYPTVVTPHPYPTSRIDYVMVKDSPHLGSYRNLVPIAGTRFDTRFQGSDHNMQLATLGIGDPAP